jgi:Uma2 family endonuclease
MTIESTQDPPWLAAVLQAEDDTEESVMGSDWHQKAIFEAYGAAGLVPWYVSSQVTIIVQFPRRERVWQPKPDLFGVVGLPPKDRTSYDTRKDGPMPHFILEIASDSTWLNDVDNKVINYGLVGIQEYVVFDPTGELFRERVRAWRAGPASMQSWPAGRRADGTEVWRSGVLALDLRFEGGIVRFDDPVQGPLPVRRELLERWHNAEQAREAAEQAREAAEQRAFAAEQALAALRAQIEKDLGPRT